MPSPSTPPTPSSQGVAASTDAASAAAAPRDHADPQSLDTPQLLEQLRQDRLWLLRQIDAGQWPAWRLDLAALERELGQLLEQAEDRLGQG
ncbi:MAG: hypothetical protein ACO3B3_04235 [Cyanobium sp.]|jgi:hypothetical protein